MAEERGERMELEQIAPGLWVRKSTPNLPVRDSFLRKMAGGSETMYRVLRQAVGDKVIDG